MTLPTDWRRGFLVDGGNLLKVVLRARLGGLDETPDRLASGVSGTVVETPDASRLGSVIHKSKPTQKHETQPTVETPDASRLGTSSTKRSQRRNTKHNPPARPPTQVGRERHPQIQANEKHETQPTRETPDASRLGASSTNPSQRRNTKHNPPARPPTQVGWVLHPRNQANEKHETQPTRETPDASRTGVSSTNPSQRRNVKHNPPARPPTQVGRERHPQIQANAETRNTTHPRDPRRKSAGSVIHKSKPTQKRKTQPTRETPDASRLGASSIPPNQNSGRLNIAIDSDRNFDSSFK